MLAKNFRIPWNVQIVVKMQDCLCGMNDVYISERVISVKIRLFQRMQKIPNTLFIVKNASMRIWAS